MDLNNCLIPPQDLTKTYAIGIGDPILINNTTRQRYLVRHMFIRYTTPPSIEGTMIIDGFPYLDESCKYSIEIKLKDKTELVGEIQVENKYCKMKFWPQLDEDWEDIYFKSQVEEVKDHTGEIYNPYSNTWSWL